MEQSRLKQIDTYFKAEIARCKMQEKEFIDDERKDESIFKKIQGNVFDIFHTIFTTALRLFGEDDKKISQFFLTKTEQISGTWRTTLNKAEENNDIESMHIEIIKLETATEAIRTVKKILEGES